VVSIRTSCVFVYDTLNKILATIVSLNSKFSEVPVPNRTTVYNYVKGFQIAGFILDSKRTQKTRVN
jgi:hypothetical protein